MTQNDISPLDVSRMTNTDADINMAGLDFSSAGMMQNGISPLDVSLMTNADANINMAGFDFSSAGSWVTTPNETDKRYYPQLGHFVTNASQSINTMSKNSVLVDETAPLDISEPDFIWRTWDEWNLRIDVLNGVQVTSMTDIQARRIVAIASGEDTPRLVRFENCYLADQPGAPESTGMALLLKPDWAEFIKPNSFNALLNSRGNWGGTPLLHEKETNIYISSSNLKHLLSDSRSDSLLLVDNGVKDTPEHVIAFVDGGYTLDWYNHSSPMHAELIDPITDTNINPLNFVAYMLVDGKPVIIPRSYSEVFNGWEDCSFVRTRIPIYEFGSFAVVYLEQVQFSDTAGKWMEDAVGHLATRGVLKGTGDGLFEPELTLTKAHFITMLIRALGVRNAPVDLDNSLIADAPDWARESIATAIELQMINSESTEEFNANGAITREEVFHLLYVGMKEVGARFDVELHIPNFVDWEEFSLSGREAAEYLSAVMIIEGYNDRLRPRDYLTRAEAAQILYKFLTMPSLIY